MYILCKQHIYCIKYQHVFCGFEWPFNLAKAMVCGKAITI